jgi:hypothetical protein
VSVRVALLGGPEAPRSALAAGLRARGVEVVGRELAAPAALAALLRARGFAPRFPEARLASRAARALRADVVHAFSPEAAAGALRAGARVVYTCLEPLDRGAVAFARRRLDMLAAAVEHSGALLAPTEEVAASLRRWMAVEATVLDLTDAEGHERLYEKLFAG